MANTIGRVRVACCNGIFSRFERQMLPKTASLIGMHPCQQNNSAPADDRMIATKVRRLAVAS
jgi:hypothetical protein